MNMKIIFTLLLVFSAVWLTPPEDTAAEERYIQETQDKNFEPPQYGDEELNFDNSSFEAGHLFESLSKGVNSENPDYISNEMDFRNPLPEVKDTDMDIDKFLEDFDKIDCPVFNGNSEDPANALCDENIVQSGFSTLGKYNSDNNDFYNYLKSTVFLPLAYEITKRTNLADVVMDSLSLNAKNSFFYNKQLVSNYNKFESTIMKIFDDISGKTSDMEANKDIINELMISALKRFHLYWNYLRFQGKFDKLKIDTKEIMRTIMKTYMMKRDFLNYVSKTLIRGIIQAYYRFIRAHKMVDILNKFGPQLMGSQIINRYKNFGDKIQSSNFNNIMAIKEISYLISLLQVYHILSFKHGLSDSNIQLNFKTEIILRIQREYENYVKLLPQESQLTRVKQIKEYTAVLLLKFKHMTFIMFQYHGIAQYANMPQMNYVRSSFAVKIYYEMLDNMLLIPKTCINFLLLKSCIVHETTKNLRYITGKYKIKRSTYGWYFLQELSSMMKSLYSKANSQTWEQWSNFKTYYYSNLFSVMYTYKRLFLVNDMDVVEDLETQLGTILQDIKKANAGNSDFNFIMADKFDNDIYDEFLSIKADYNNYAPVEKDATVINFLKTRVNKFVDNFYKENEKATISEGFQAVKAKYKEAVDNWVNSVLNRPETVISVSTANVSPEFQQLNFQPEEENGTGIAGNYPGNLAVPNNNQDQRAENDRGQNIPGSISNFQQSLQEKAGQLPNQQSPNIQFNGPVQPVLIPVAVANQNVVVQQDSENNAKEQENQGQNNNTEEAGDEGDQKKKNIQGVVDDSVAQGKAEIPEQGSQEVPAAGNQSEGNEGQEEQAAEVQPAQTQSADEQNDGLGSQSSESPGERKLKSRPKPVKQLKNSKKVKK